MRSLWRRLSQWSPDAEGLAVWLEPCDVDGSRSGTLLRVGGTFLSLPCMINFLNACKSGGGNLGYAALNCAVSSNSVADPVGGATARATRRSEGRAVRLLLCCIEEIAVGRSGLFRSC